MTKLPACYGIIPSRYASHRFPGKPLADILGQPMFWHVFQRASACPLLQSVVLATDDPRIYAAAEQHAVPAVMTGDHPSGTDRVLEAARLIGVPEDAVVVNIQGDEPALDPEMLTELLTPFAHPAVQITTLATPISAGEAQNPDRVKVVFAKDGRALYFSRAPVPYRQRPNEDPYFLHIGIYAFRMRTLNRFVSLGPSRLEFTEKLEQLRLLENNIPIHVVQTAYQGTGVDRPDDIPAICELIKETMAKLAETNKSSPATGKCSCRPGLPGPSSLIGAPGRATER